MEAFNRQAKLNQLQQERNKAAYEYAGFHQGTIKHMGNGILSFDGEIDTSIDCGKRLVELDLAIKQLTENKKH